MTDYTCDDDIILWFDGTWCYRRELWEMDHMSHEPYEEVLFLDGNNPKYLAICEE